MANSKDKPPSYESIIQDYMAAATGPLPVAQLIDQILAIHPTSAKNPRAAMRTHVHQTVGQLLVFIDKDTVLPLRLAWQGARFRLPLNRDIIRQGLVDITEDLAAYLPMHFKVEMVQFVDGAGQPIKVQLRKEEQAVDGPFGTVAFVTVWANLGDWLRAQRAKAEDQLLLTVMDWENGVFQLALEPASQYKPTLRVERNVALANLFFEMLDDAPQDDSIFTWNAVPTVYARLPDKMGYPPDQWVTVLQLDGRLRTDGIMIRYADSPLTPMEEMFMGERNQDDELPVPSLSKAEQAQVYRFKAALVNRPAIWRSIEIQGKHRLADLDLTLRRAFNHDDSDHLAGFWQLVPRGESGQAGTKRKAGRAGRFREVDLGTMNPFGGGDGADTKIAELGLAVGAQLKYVYDFGDWIEHRLSLEAIEAPVARTKYPREIGRNTPQYLYCVECQARGRQTVAKWMCLESTAEHGDEVLVCDDCAQERHADHYMDEILY